MNFDENFHTRNFKIGNNILNAFHLMTQITYVNRKGKAILSFNYHIELLNLPTYLELERRSFIYEQENHLNFLDQLSVDKNFGIEAKLLHQK